MGARGSIKKTHYKREGREQDDRISSYVGRVSATACMFGTR